MNTEITDEKEQALIDAAYAVARVADLMVATLPATAQAHIGPLLANGASLAVSCLLTPFPTFRLCLLPPKPDDDVLELAICSPAPGSLRKPVSGETSH